MKRKRKEKSERMSEREGKRKIETVLPIRKRFELEYVSIAKFSSVGIRSFQRYVIVYRLLNFPSRLFPIGRKFQLLN